jgi:adenosylcobinamide-phosphate synthase
MLGLVPLVVPLVVLLAVLVALALDRWLGEPPVRWHPVVWMGHALGWSGRWVQTHTRQQPGGALDLAPAETPDYKAFGLGALVWSAWAALVFLVAWGLQYGIGCGIAYGLVQSVVPGLAAGFFATLLLGLLLKPLLAWAMLCNEVQAVELALDTAHGGSLAAGRARLCWLVSRDVDALTETEVRESAIETLAENLNDSVVAPIFWFVLLGLPGAALYRFANTADAMWGYRGMYKGQNWEWAGKWAARADDVLGYVPARITGMLLLLVAGRYRLWRLLQWRCEARKTPSPNSGWPMAAMALALGVALRKPGVYVLNPAGRPVQPPDTALAVNLASKVLLAGVFIACIAIIFIVIRWPL